jgi:hypothetical protein
MPDPLVAAIVSSIISSVTEGALAPPPPDPAMGIVRILPGETRKGIMTSSAFGHIVIDGTSMPLSPGVQIRNDLNMLVMPSMIQGPAPIRYQVDVTGFVFRVWILSATEASLPENR